MLEVRQDIRKLIFEGANQDIIREHAINHGMVSLHESAIDKMKKGITTIQEVIKLTVSD